MATPPTIDPFPDLALRSLNADWTYARWETLPGDGNRYEVLDGSLHLSDVPSTFHQWIVNELLRYVGFPARDRSLAYPFTAPIGLLIPGAQPAQPDFLLVRRERAAILSPSNAETDTVTKLRIYARAGVPEYWIVRPATRDVLVHWEPDHAAGTYARTRHIPADGRLDSPTLPLGLAVADLFAGAPDTTP